MLVNGKALDIPSGTTILQLLERLGICHEKVVVEVNMQIIAKEDYQEMLLHEGDKVEIVSFVGGG